MSTDLITDAEVDVDELIDRERVGDIQASKRQVREDIRQAHLALQDGRIDRNRANLQIARAVGMHVTELRYPLSKTDVGQRYWQHTEIGTWEVPPPSVAELAWKHKLQNGVGYIPPESARDYSTLPEGYSLLDEQTTDTQRVELRGLESFMAADWQQTVQHGARFTVDHLGDVTVTHATTETIPRRLSREAYARVQEFCGEIGLDVDYDAGRPFTDYSEDWQESVLYQDWREAVVRPPQNDFVILVTAGSKTPVSGTGKTTLTTQLAKHCDRTEQGFDAEEKATVDVGTMAYELAPKLEEGSAIVCDEAQGTPGSQGMDARRSMKQEVIDSISAILANRNSGYTIIIAAQRTDHLDKRLAPIVDAWLLIRDAPPNPLATYYEIWEDDFNFSSSDIETPGKEDFTWDSLPAGDEDYSVLEELKEESKTKGSDDDEDKELPKDTQKKIAQEWRNAGKSTRWIAENVDTISYGYSWVAEHTNAPENDATEANA